MQQTSQRPVVIVIDSMTSFQKYENEDGIAQFNELARIRWAQHKARPPK